MDQHSVAIHALPGELGSQVGGTDRDGPERLHHFFVLYALGTIVTRLLQ